LKAGDPAAAQPLWERYVGRLVRLARTRLRQTRGRAADEEDVALSAFASFCKGAEQGRFPRLDDRHDLWQLLLVLTARKAAGLVQRGARLKGGGGSEGGGVGPGRGPGSLAGGAGPLTPGAPGPGAAPGGLPGADSPAGPLPPVARAAADRAGVPPGGGPHPP